MEIPSPDPLVAGSKAAAYAALINALPKDQPQLVAEVFAEMKSRPSGERSAGGRADGLEPFKKEIRWKRDGWNLGFCFATFCFFF